MNKISNKSGFTLIELLVVIGILAVLAFICVPIVNDVIENARASRDVQDMRSMELSVNLCAIDGRSYLSATYDMPNFESVLREVSDGDTDYKTLANNRCNATFDKDFMPQTAKAVCTAMFVYCKIENENLLIPSQFGYDYYYNVDTGSLIKAEKGITSRETLKNLLMERRDEDDLTGKWINITSSYEKGLTNEFPQEDSVLYTSIN